MNGEAGSPSDEIDGNCKMKLMRQSTGSLVSVIVTAGTVLLAQENSSAADKSPMTKDSSSISSAAFQKQVVEAGGRVDFVFGDDRSFKECHASTLVETARGTLLCAWFAGTREKNPDVGIWLSCFDGESWSRPQRAAKVGEVAHWNPVLFRDAGDTVYLFFKVGVDVPHWRTYWMQSTDHGDSWSDPVPLVAGDVGGRGPVKNKPIILSDGTWLAPASTEVEINGFDIWKAFADRSTDGGTTWIRTEDFVVPDKSDPKFRGVGAIQPTLWESKPGHVHALMRTGAGIVWRTDSFDGGRTWKPLSATELPNNNSGLDALGLGEGRVLLVYNPVGKNWGPRTPLDLAISSDNGSSWQTITHLEDDRNLRHEYSYPSIIATTDGVALTYTWRRERVRCWQIPAGALGVSPETP